MEEELELTVEAADYLIKNALISVDLLGNPSYQAHYSLAALEGQ